MGLNAMRQDELVAEKYTCVIYAATVTDMSYTDTALQDSSRRTSLSGRLAMVVALMFQNGH